MSVSAMTPTATAGTPDGKPREVAPFLKNLRKMLQVESADVIRWTPDGRAFEIHDMERMMNVVLPKYFKHRKYTSFQRQLNYFNFKKWTKSKAVVCTFSNEYFLRDQPDLAWRIARKKSIQNGSGGSKNKQCPSAKPSAALAASPDSTSFRHSPNSWKITDMSIMIPTKRESHHEAFPSPTDMDMLLLEHDVDTRRFPVNPLYYGTHDAAPESLDWIDNILPSMNLFPHGDDGSFGDHFGAPLLRHTQFVFPPGSMTSSDFLPGSMPSSV
ncbi:TPA: hypothetical protein N0F65_006738 [Lagenidium giganteum]|uniref:HSF-type DNA-binding domain-containing protein n=1 Tax=Lagenidium giganteum TaxID=4803 RepID=A0AAV2YZM3_9STRA|nr:TPA: hypothetical protein N0F65_006738 [Lagenidium giganteum]